MATPWHPSHDMRDVGNDLVSDMACTKCGLSDDHAEIVQECTVKGKVTPGIGKDHYSVHRDVDWCPDTVKLDPKKFKHVPGKHLWDYGRRLTDDFRIHEVKCCAKCHLTVEETRTVVLADIMEATARYKSVKQRIQAEISAKNAELERERGVAQRYLRGFIDAEDLE